MIENKIISHQAKALYGAKNQNNSQISYFEYLENVHEIFRNKNMVEINPISLPAYLLTDLVHEPQRRSIFLKMVKNGIYEMFIDGSNSRDDVKRYFLMALSDRVEAEKALEIRNFLFEEFPELFFKHQDLRKKQNTIKKKLLQSEQEMFQNAMGLSRNLKCWCNRGRLIVQKKDESHAIRILNSIMSDKLEFCIPTVVRDI